MAAPLPNFTGAAVMQTNEYDPAIHNTLAAGSFSRRDGSEAALNPEEDLGIQLVVIQPPLHARVAIGKEKERKPIDPPPILRLVGKRSDRKSPTYYSPYYFAICDLVTEDYETITRGGKSVTNALVGTRTSSIHQLKDPQYGEGGFFVFGDLGVKIEGRFRLCFDVYDRDDINPDGSSIYHVARQFSDAFTVFSPKQFPGMSESTNLTRSFWEQGVRLRLRKDSQAMKTRKRNRRTAEDLDANQNLKRRDFGPNESNAELKSGSSHTMSPPDGLIDFTATPDMTAITLPGASTSQALMPTSSSHPGSSELTSMYLSSPVTSHFEPHYHPMVSATDFTSGSPLNRSNPYHQVYPTSFSPNNPMQSVFGTTSTLGQGQIIGFDSITSHSMTAPNTVASNHLVPFLAQPDPRTPQVDTTGQFRGPFIPQNFHEYTGNDGNHPGIPFPQ
ncbi:velvet factor-domain-containing protein [Mariannaea sp. PMI_226]|nr:velvet factor-domain-containing protein [Mariannaea sp. PMI_226]